MFPRRNWDSPTPSLASECAPPPGTKEEGGHTRLRASGWGSPNSNDWRKSLSLCLLCAVDEAGCDCRALDLLDSTVVDTSLDINRGMWMQKVSTGALDLLDFTAVDTSLDINCGMWMEKVSRGALDLQDSTVVDTSLDINDINRGIVK
jgi:hypothetical protein